MKSRVWAAALILVATMLMVAAPAEAGKKFTWGFVGDEFSDDLLTSDDPQVRDKWMGRAADAEASFVRLNTYWGQTVDSPPADPRNPADPAYDWSAIDARVQSARANGLEPILTVLSAPRWAEAPGRPSEVRIGTWKPNPEALGDFAAALARQYAGSVSFYEAWNEPNLDNYLNPQWNGTSPASPDLYRPMLNRFHDGIKSVDPQATVVTAGTSPVGDGPGGKIMRPLQFWREVMCLDGKLKKKCGDQARFDIFGHNAINYPKDPPSQSGPHPDDVTPADFGELRKLLKAAEKAGTAKGSNKHDLWSTESWYESKPPERKAFSLKGQAEAMQEAMYILWKQGASNVLWLQVRDSPYDPSTPALIGYQSGIYFINEKPKPSAKALRFPFVADRVSKKKVILWGVPPNNGKVKIAAKGKGVKGKAKTTKLKGKAGQVFKTKLKVTGKVKFKAKAKGAKSLAAKVGKK